MNGHEQRHASEQVDPKCRRVVEWTREYLNSDYTLRDYTLNERIEDEGRTYILGLQNPADAWTHDLCLRRDGRNFTLPQTPDELPTWLYTFTYGKIGAPWCDVPPRTP